MARDVTTFCDWLDARDADAMARAWAALDANHVKVCEPNVHITTQGTARLAAAFLGWPIERLTWLDHESAMGPPTYKAERAAHRVFLENDLDERVDCWEYFTLHEVREGDRGVQHVSVGAHISDGTRDGLSRGSSVVRLFDRATATGASIFVGRQTVATIGDPAIDLSAIDLYMHWDAFELPWQHYEPECVRSLVAHMASAVDPAYEASAQWPGGVISETVMPDTDPASPGTRYTRRRYCADALAIEISEVHHKMSSGRIEGWATTEALGLPWGYWLRVIVHFDANGTKGDVRMRVPIATGKAVMARARDFATREADRIRDQLA